MTKDIYITRALIVAEPWIDLILSGEKTWEMRSSINRILGWVGLIRKGSGQIVGAVRMTGAGAALTKGELLEHVERHCIPIAMIESGAIGKWTTPWYMEEAVEFSEPVPYDHPSGAVTWVSLDESVAVAVSAKVGRAATEVSGKAFSSLFGMLQDIDGLTIPIATVDATKPSSQNVSAHKGRLLGVVSLKPSGLRNNHISMRSIVKEFPKALVGGREIVPPCYATLTAQGLPAVSTDICRRHIFFRDRGWTRRFFERNDAKAGDEVEVWEIGDRHYHLRLKGAS